MWKIITPWTSSFSPFKFAIMFANIFRTQARVVLSRPRSLPSECVRNMHLSMRCSGRLPQLATIRSFSNGNSRWEQQDNDEGSNRFAQGQEETSTLFIRNLPYSATESQVLELFSEHGAAIVRMRRNDRGDNVGYAHVVFESPDAAKNIVENSRSSLPELGGREIYVDVAIPRGDRSNDRAERRSERPSNPPSRTLFLGNLPYDVDEQELRSIFEGLVDIATIRIGRSEDGQTRGFAHMDVNSVDDAQRVHEAHQNEPFQVQGRTLRIDFSGEPRQRRGGGDRSGRGDQPRRQRRDSRW
ncbi:Nucleolin [Grifola frondosa]|uniref:Nucleolin n=1 Tax=Grifola frondosa TaxID=5627 RepID=A0A1C7MER5_GRIFR|nr:Nucleolin [Grifola frondosa]